MFTYNPVMKEMLSRLNENDREVLDKKTVSVFLNEENLKKISLFSYKLHDQSHAEKLEKKGVVLFPASITHSHPFSKMLENHIVFNCAMPLMRQMAEKGNLVVMSIKNAKAGYFFSSGVYFDVLNRIITCKDRIRYDHVNAHRDICSSTFANSSFGKRLKGKNFFLYDELHYWKETELRNFLEIHKPQNILGTVIYPPELLKGIKHSMNPDCYKFKVLGEKLIWAPDGKWQQAYEQPRECQILKSKKIIVDDQTYSVEVLESAYCHHLILITKEGRPGKENLIFSDYDVIDPTIFASMHSFGSELVCKTLIFKKIFSYFASLKKPDLTSIEAKFRQLKNDDYDMAENFVLLDFFSSLIEKGYAKGGKTFDKSFVDAILLNLPDDILRFSKDGTKLSNARLLSLVQDFKVEIELEVWNISYTYTKADISLGLDSDEETFMIEISSNDFSLSGASEICNRVSSPYSLISKELKGDEPLGDMYVCFQNARQCYGQRRSSSARCKPYERKARKYAYKAPLSILSSDQVSYMNEGAGTHIFTRVIAEMYIELSSKVRIEPYHNGWMVYFREIEEEIYEEDVEIIDEDEEARAAPEEDLIEMAFIDQKANEDAEVCTDFLAKENFCLLRAIASALGEKLENFCETLAESDRLYWVPRFSQDLPMGRKEIERIVKRQPLTISVKLSNSSAHDFINSADMREKRKVVIYYDGTHYTTSQMGVGKELPIGKSIRRNELYRAILDQASIPEDRTIVTRASRERASFLIENFNEGTNGMLSKGDLEKEVAYLRDSKDEFQNYACLPLLGFAGSGKSAPIQNALSRGESKRIVVILPRKILCDDWKRKCTKGVIIMTFEVALMDKRAFDVVILDEITLFPPGYVDALVYLKKLNHVIVIGDPMQTEYHNEESKALSECSYGNLECLKVNQDKKVPYLYYSYRLPRQFDLFDVSCFGEGEYERAPIQSDLQSAIRHCEKKGTTRDEIVVLCAAREEKTVFASGYGLNCMTIGESQGLTFDKEVLIAVSPHLAKAGDKALYVAVTRSRKCSIFFLSGAKDPQKLLNMTDGCFLDKVLRKKDTVSAPIFARAMFHDFEYIEDPMRGTDSSFDLVKSDEVNREELLEGDLFLQSQIFLGQRLTVRETQPEEVIMQKEVIKTHLPLESEDLPLVCNHEYIRAKELREFRHVMDQSDQFRDNPNPLSFEAIYPRHKMSDSVTFWEAVKKRLRFSDHEKEAKKLKKAQIMGKFLFDTFIKKVPLDSMVEEDMLCEAQEDFERTKLKKSAATLAKHSSRSDPDLDIHQVMIFMKTQLCTKYEKRYCDAKAGQTLACFHHAILCYFSRWCRYIEKKMSKYLPKRFYVHQRKNFDQLNDYVKEMWVDGVALESDYEAFDASQDANILAFELLIMQHLQIPMEVIENYKYLKLHLGSKLGNFAIMRFTGEFCTFLFNTLANMAFTFCRYKIPDTAVIMFAGDDMCASEPMELNRANDWVFKVLTLKAKVQYTREATFCGWRISACGIAKQPKLVYERFMIAEERGNLSECLESYFLEMNYAYALGDRLLELFDQESLSYHYLLVRKFIKLSGELKGRAAKLVRDYLSNKEIFCGLTLS